jgi:hypothetical protein
MSEGSAPIENVHHAATLYHRGIICPAEMWNRITDPLTTQTAVTILDGLPVNLQDTLRRAYAERPWSLRTGELDNDVRREVERWRMQDGPSSVK